MKRLLILLLSVLMLLSAVGCAKPGDPTETTIPLPKDTTGKYLLNETRNEAIIDDAGTVTQANDGNGRVFYQIFVGSFSDSNGDGIGDLRGIINRMDYLNDGDPNSGVSLGVEGIWLTPIFKSPTYHKYDTTDYYEIDPQFGTEQDLKDLIKICHERDVKLILDLVLNHTGMNHPWFQAFAKAHKEKDTEDEYYDFYSHSPTRIKGKTHSVIPGCKDFYECNFFTQMPELNYDNEAVRTTMVDLAKHYIDMGIDGFRFDAAKYIYFEDTAKNVEFWNWYLGELRAMKEDIYTVAEVWEGDSITIPYTAATDCFNFTMSQAHGQIAAAAMDGNVNNYVNYISSYTKSIQANRPNAMLITFLANHDMDRAAGFVTTATGYAKTAATLSILTPGSPYIYYGEEIGMLGSRPATSNTDANRRLAMLWGDNDTIKNPSEATYKNKQSNGTVADQLPNGDSLYNHYKKLISIRKANPEIAYGTFTPLNTDTKAAGFQSTWNGKTVAVMHNTTDAAVTIDLSQVTETTFSTLSAIVGTGSAKLEGTTLTLDAQTSVVLR
jgi:glycosidase